MRVVFVHNGAESLGVEALSAYLKSKGHETFLVFDPSSFSGTSGREIPLLARLFNMPIERVARKALEYNPDLVAFSCVTGVYQWALKVAREIKLRKNVPTVFGGIHPTSVPERVIVEDAIDAVVLGEGEHALEEIVADIKDNVIHNLGIKNAWIKRDGIVHKNPIRPYIRNLDDLPFLDKALFYDKIPLLEKAYLTMTSRGCFFKCSYCCNNLYFKLYSNEKDHVRRRSADNVIEELRIVRRRGITKYVEFWDDIFTLNKKWLREFAPKYRNKIGLPFLCYAHPRFIDEETVDLLASAGCETIKMGIQSVDPKTLREVLHRVGLVEDVRRAARMLEEKGIKLVVEHIIGIPGEGPENQEEAARIYSEIRAKKYNSYSLVHFPGTEIIKISKEMGLLDEEKINAIESGDPSVKYSIMLPTGSPSKEAQLLHNYHILFDLMPFLPVWLRKFIIRHRIVRFLRFNSILHQTLMVLNALRTRDWEDLIKVRYAISRKNVP